MHDDSHSILILVSSGKQLYASNVSQVRDQPMPGEDEPLHAYVEVNTPGKYSSCRLQLRVEMKPGILHLMISQGDEPIKVQKAVAKIKEIIQQGIDVSIYQSLID